MLDSLLSARVRAFYELPWVIPALVLLEMTDEDLDNLDTARGTARYWGVLKTVLTRIEEAGP